MSHPRIVRPVFAALACLAALLLPLAASAEEPSAAAAREDIKNTLGFVPGFLAAVPDAALPGAWQEMKTLQMSPNTALSPKVKELIGLAVASQVPCKYCVYAHTEFAKLGGASPTECKEAVLMAALSRHWSTMLQGHQTDLAKFRAEIARAIEHMKKMAASKTAPPRIDVVDAATALQDIQNTFGFVPEFLKTFPPQALAGAWREMRDVEMSPSTALSGKDKSLIGLAVSSQVPCRFCIHADTEFAKLEGATSAELSEAIAMAAITRHWSTFLNGTQTDEKSFMKDIDRLVKNVKKQAAAAKPTAQATPALATGKKPEALAHAATQ